MLSTRLYSCLYHNHLVPSVRCTHITCSSRRPLRAAAFVKVTLKFHWEKMKLEKKINYIVMNVNLADIHMCNHRKIIIAICRLLVSNRIIFWNINILEYGPLLWSLYVGGSHWNYGKILLSVVWWTEQKSILWRYDWYGEFTSNFWWFRKSIQW